MKRLILFLFLPALLSSQTILNTKYAFHGALGYGRSATVGQPARTIYKVTNLNDSGAGSLRDGCSQPNRDVVFEVSGYIDLLSKLNVSNNTVIYGQSAFRAGGQGITLRMGGTAYNNALLNPNGNHIVVRFLRARRGEGMSNGECCGDGIRPVGHNIVIDHCSISWGTDENISTYSAQNLTIQNNIISEGLYLATHDYSANTSHGAYQAGHSKGSIMEDGSGAYVINNVSYIGNIFSNNDQRNPLTAFGGRCEIVGNIIDRPATIATDLNGSTSGQSENNVVKNLYIAGMDTRTSRHEINVRNTSTVDLYVQGNIGWNRTDDTQNEWLAVGNSSNDISETGVREFNPFPTDYSEYYTALPSAATLRDTSYTNYKGAFLNRDATDVGVIDKVLNGGSTVKKQMANRPNYDATNYSGISDYYDIVNSVSEAGGYPGLTAMTGLSADANSIETFFKSDHGFTDPNAVKTNWTFDDVSVVNNANYTNFQMYMMWLAGDFGNVSAENKPPRNGLIQQYLINY